MRVPIPGSVPAGSSVALSRLHGAAYATYATSAATARGKHYQQEPGESNVKDAVQGCFHMSPLFKTPAAYFPRLSLSAPCRVGRSVDLPYTPVICTASRRGASLSAARPTVCRAGHRLGFGTGTEVQHDRRVGQLSPVGASRADGRDRSSDGLTCASDRSHLWCR